jgi:hypothetical protein
MAGLFPGHFCIFRAVPAFAGRRFEIANAIAARECHAQILHHRYGNGRDTCGQHSVRR